MKVCIHIVCALLTIKPQVVQSGGKTLADELLEFHFHGMNSTDFLLKNYLNRAKKK